MGSNRDKQRLVNSVYFTIRLNCRIILENGNYANFDSVKISFSLINSPPPESFAPENLEGGPLKKFLAAPPEKNPRRKSAIVVVV